MKVEVELPELPEGYEYTGKMFPEKGDEFVSYVDVHTWTCCATSSCMYPVVRKKQLTYGDLCTGEWFRFADEAIPRQQRESLISHGDRPVVRVKVTYEDVK